MTTRARFPRSLPLALLLAVLLPAALAAQNSPSDQGGDSGWAFSVGLFDIGQSEKATEAGVEYRFAPRRIWRFDLKQVVGFSGTDDGAFWAYAGFRWDVELNERWVLTPNAGTALYEQGDGKDLGHVIEFRTGLEIARRFANGHRLGLCLYHLSNASISHDNPGEESLVLSYSLGR